MHGNDIAIKRHKSQNAAPAHHIIVADNGGWWHKRAHFIRKEQQLENLQSLAFKWDFTVQRRGITPALRILPLHPGLTVATIGLSTVHYDISATVPAGGQQKLNVALFR